FPAPGSAGPDAGGNLIGFVYGEDGKSPVQDAVVLLKGMATDKIYQSEPTTKTGDYRIFNIESGAYILGLKINEKTFNVDGYVKVSAEKTEIVSFLLEPPGPGGALLNGQGWCCHEDKVFKSTLEECNKRGGDFFPTKKEAQEHCGESLLAFFKTPTGMATFIIGTGTMTLINKLFRKYYQEETSSTEYYLP
ncbi:MAG TPA: carboxypeptidase-like regulatory domain-containing protein, partial [Candidatus Deferrimicrobium sp.]|nr:carboxypeptidase-like regulatory domain-containing protein [Candidatus Deferrimicrobium sp.]